MLFEPSQNQRHGIASIIFGEATTAAKSGSDSLETVPGPGRKRM
jgi:hypothetical protein